jgi:hypothetical protein
MTTSKTHRKIGPHVLALAAFLAVCVPATAFGATFVPRCRVGGVDVPCSGQLAKSAGGFGVDVSTGLSTGDVAIVSGGAITVGPLTASALPSSIDPLKLSPGTITSTVLGRIAGLTSNVQTQLDGKVTAGSALAAHGPLIGNGTTYPSAISEGTAGQVLTSQGPGSDPVMANPITATYGSSTLGSTYTIPTDNGSYASTGLTTTLPGAGTYILICSVRTNIQASTTPGAYILTELYNTTDGAAITDSEQIGAYGSTINVAYYGTSTVFVFVTVAASKTIALYTKTVAPSSTATRTVNSDSNGRSRIGYVKIAN